MAGYEIKVPISIKGGEAKAGKRLADDFLKSIKGSFQGFGFGKEGAGKGGEVIPGIGKIAASVGIIAGIWQGIAPILKPVLKMLSILLTLLLLPLMPLIKQMVSGLAKTAGKVSEAQQAAGGGMAGMLAGFGELLKSPTIWALAGVGLAASFAASLLGGAGLAGAIALAIGLGLVFTSIGEDEVKNKVAAAGLVGIAAGVATAMVTGSPIAGILVGGLAFYLSSEFILDTVTLDELKTALKNAAVVGIATAIAVSIMTGNPIVGVLAGTLTFALSLVWDLSGEKEPKFAKGEIEKAWKGYSGTAVLEIPQIDLPKNFWEMKDASIEATNSVISDLDRIPREINTKHYIETVYI